MLGVSKLSWRAGWPLFPALLAGALLALWIGPRKRGPTTPAVPLDDWDIPRLVAYLNDKGLGLRAVSTEADGVLRFTAFLTTTSKTWDNFNRLPNDERQINEWQGTLYCARGMGEDFCSDITLQWGDGSLIVGPFLVYGDRELLGRVRAALTAPEQYGS